MGGAGRGVPDVNLLARARLDERVGDVTESVVLTRSSAARCGGGEVIVPIPGDTGLRQKGAKHHDGNPWPD